MEDESWIEHQPTATKQEGKVWIPKDAHRPQVVRQHLTPNKSLLLICFTVNKKISIKVIPYPQTINSDVYVDFLKTTGDRWRTLRRDPTRLSELHYQHDNAKPHTSNFTKDYLNKRGVSLIFQSPYSPDFNFCDR